jgi:hypothetical protein
MQVDDLVAIAKEAQGVLSWDSSSLIRVAGVLAVKVNAIQNLSGQEKQKLVCQVLKRVLEDVEKKEVSEEPTEEKKKSLTDHFASLNKSVDDVIPASLELALAAARGKLDLKKVKMSVWVRYFSCCIRSAVTVLVSNNVISQDQAKKATDVIVSVEAKAADAAEKADEAAAEAETEKEKEKMEFEQANPMRSQESATQESKPEEAVKSE